MAALSFIFVVLDHSTVCVLNLYKDSLIEMYSIQVRTVLRNNFSTHISMSWHSYTTQLRTVIDSTILKHSNCIF